MIIMSHGHDHGHHHEYHHEHDGCDEAMERKKIIIKLISAAVIFIAALIVEHFSGKTVSAPIYLAAYLIAGFDVIKEAFENIRHGEVFGEEFLMAVASIGAVLIGQFAEAAAVMILYCLGEFLQDLAVDRSRESISKLMDIRPDHANLIDNDGTERTVDPAEVRPGDIIAVKPGERIPLDGEVTEGNTMLDTAALTGESVPKSIHPGDQVLSGCINSTGLIRVKVTKEYGDSTASRILELVEHASERKSKSEDFISKFAHVYTPVVCIAALMLAVIPSLVFGEPIKWIERALTFLVISCPCALVISVPLTFFAGIGTASREGILVKGSNYLEALADVKTAVFDKTGTLTEGVFEVQKCIMAAGSKMTQDELTELAAYAESSSSHPIAQSVMRSYGKEIDRTQINEVKETAGYGVTAGVRGHVVKAGNAGLLEKAEIVFESCSENGTVVYVAVDGRYEGCMVVSDRIKDDAVQAVSGLKKCGIRKTVMLTGDNSRAASYAAEQTGVDEVYSGLLPADKVEIVEKLIAENGEKEKLIFAGDGVNDAPVLARADIGAAMGAMGSDAAIEAADVVIMDDKPSRLVTAVKLARRTRRIAAQNTAFAIIIKILILILGAFGLAGMWAAVFADVGVALLCVLSSLRNMKRI